MAAPIPQPGIENIKLYTPGQIGKSNKPIRKLSSNENLYGPSKRAIEAVRSAADTLWQYPSTDHLALRRAIGEVHDLPMDQIICGGMGSDEILYLIAQAYAGEGDEIIVTEHGFEVYRIAAHAVGAALIISSEKNRVVDIDAILSSLTPKSKIVYIANPANPTGTILPADELERLAITLPEEVILVIDSAYAEFAADYDGGARLAARQNNVIMTRTFSKLYGLGGLRIGWAFADQNIIDTLNRIRIPFNISQTALAGAEAAMLDQEYAQYCADNIIGDREKLRIGLLKLGLEIDKSHTNFLLVRFADENAAKQAFRALADEGIFVRQVSHYGFAEALRISIGLAEDCQNILRILKAHMKKGSRG